MGYQETMAMLVITRLGKHHLTTRQAPSCTATEPTARWGSDFPYATEHSSYAEAGWRCGQFHGISMMFLWDIYGVSR
jgi:hypothetical protein